MAKNATVLYHPGTNMGHGESVAWDSEPVADRDPTAFNRRRWQFANGAGARFGSTPEQRLGDVKGYVPGVGKIATPPSSALTDAQWDKLFPGSVISLPPAPGAKPSAQAATAPSSDGNVNPYSDDPETASALALPAAETPPAATHAPGEVSPYEDALSGQRSPRELAIMANPSDWRGKSGINSAPPMTNFMPGDSGTNSLADHAYYAGPHIANNASLADDKALYAPGGSRGPLLGVTQNGDTFKNPGALGGGYQQTSPQEMSAIAQKYSTPGQTSPKIAGLSTQQPSDSTGQRAVQPQPKKVAGPDAGRVDPFS